MNLTATIDGKFIFLIRVATSHEEIEDIHPRDLCAKCRQIASFWNDASNKYYCAKCAKVCCGEFWIHQQSTETQCGKPVVQWWKGKGYCKDHLPKDFKKFKEKQTGIALTTAAARIAELETERDADRVIFENTRDALLGADKSLRRWHVWRFRQLKTTWEGERDTLQAHVARLTEALEKMTTGEPLCDDHHCGACGCHEKIAHDAITPEGKGDQ